MGCKRKSSSLHSSSEVLSGVKVAGVTVKGSRTGLTAIVGRVGGGDRIGNHVKFGLFETGSSRSSERLRLWITNGSKLEKLASLMVATVAGCVIGQNLVM